MPEPLVASGGFCAPVHPIYQLGFRLIPDNPEGLLALWRKEFEALVDSPHPPLPPITKPFKRHEAIVQRRMAGAKQTAMEASINELAKCLEGGSKLSTISDLLPKFTAPRGTIDFIKPPVGEGHGQPWS